ncbi:hypothetical protein BJ684DRAFT_20227 [Piptocephalis cylindrospora]|uniref:ATP synthase subunit 4 n=1 Tax=Piptocephalis cylindrospora TaxID=1907219 RepID=A0A4P9Y330_9FUNG|nr:hypothetical protein BJ684DRAFT_20227 [Piptocephalis cylindrospora]|eukprot:RKP13265.1 hypothetical protein BJ684DRAFT_20227 [Piptocephalis cylindrospora]
MSLRLLAQGTARSAARVTAVPAQAAVPALRAYSSATESKEVEAPKKKALSLLDALPGNSLVSKTGFAVLGCGATAALVSKELYVVNEETLFLASFVGLVSALVTMSRGPYNEWAAGQIAKMKGLMDDARSRHKEAVTTRIDKVGEMRDVVDVTKGLFEMSKEMAEMEAKAFELKQKSALSHEIRSVLDSWVRYETSVREREQKDLAEQVISRVRAALEDPKAQKQIMSQCLADVERLTKTA